MDGLFILGFLTTLTLLRLIADYLIYLYDGSMVCLLDVIFSFCFLVSCGCLRTDRASFSASSLAAFKPPLS
jgi:hypothetical protein